MSWLHKYLGLDAVRTGVATLLDRARQMEAQMAVSTDALVAVAQKLKADNAAEIQLLTDLRNQGADMAARLQSVQDQLAERLEGDDTSAIQATIDGVVTDLTQISNDAEAAVRNNTAVPNMPQQVQAPAAT